jgi:uncharacterized UBP type Zn finger protein
MDVVFFSLFATPHRFVEKQRGSSDICGHGHDSKAFSADFKKELTTMISTIRTSRETKKMCRSFRAFLRKHRGCRLVRSYPDFAGSQQREALEFLQFILSALGMNGQKKLGAEAVVEKRFGVFAKSRQNVAWKDWFKVTDKKASVIYRVPYQEFKKHRRLSSYLRYRQDDFNIDAKYKGCTVNCTEEIISLDRFADLLVVSVERYDPVQSALVGQQSVEVCHDSVQIPLTLTDSTGKTLQLDAVILHLGDTISSGHYVSFKRCDTRWFFFDDLEDEIIAYDSWAEALRCPHADPRTHGVLYFYTLL